MKKIIITTILFLSIAISGFAQSDKMKESAKEKVEALNKEILDGNKTLGLTDAQKIKIYNIHIERMKEIRKANKEGADKDEKKEINKKYFQKIYKDILTKEQLKARKKGKDNEED